MHANIFMQKFSPQQVIYVNIMEAKSFVLTGSSANFFKIHKPSIASINYSCSNASKRFIKELEETNLSWFQILQKNTSSLFQELFLIYCVYLAPFVLPFFHDYFAFRN